MKRGRPGVGKRGRRREDIGREFCREKEEGGETEEEGG